MLPLTFPLFSPFSIVLFSPLVCPLSFPSLSLSSLSYSYSSSLSPLSRAGMEEHVI